MEVNIDYPFGAIQEESAVYAATIALPEVKNKKAQYTVAQLTGSPTLTVTANTQLKAGAELVLFLNADGTERTATFTTGFKSAAVVVAVNKTVTVTFEYDGTDFRQKSVGAYN